MTEPEHANIPLVPDVLEPAFWKSKKFIAAMVHHALVWSGVIVGGVLNRQSLAVSLPAAIASSTAVTVGQNATQASVDKAQANSYAYPSGGVYPPQPPAPITIVQPAGSIAPSPGHNAGMP